MCTKTTAINKSNTLYVQIPICCLHFFTSYLGTVGHVNLSPAGGASHLFKNKYISYCKSLFSHVMKMCNLIYCSAYFKLEYNNVILFVISKCRAFLQRKAKQGKHNCHSVLAIVSHWYCSLQVTELLYFFFKVIRLK